jgi:release factor glutamine methyltransferase
MNAREAAADVRTRLAGAGIEDASFEAEYLVRNASGLTREQFFLAPDLDRAALEQLERAAVRRVAREPANYISGTREFWGLEIGVGPAVLVPRPETELLVELALDEARDIESPLILDVGTGSGCIAVALAHELGRSARIVAMDVSNEALAVAAANARKHNAPVSFVRGDLAGATRRADIVLANLPYIPSFEIDLLEPEVSQWEPRVALDGGADGFELIRRLLHDCASRLKPRLLALEVGYGMAETAREIAEGHGAEVSIIADFAGIDRIVCCRWR